jgi:hypothetical protein
LARQRIARRQGTPVLQTAPRRPVLKQFQVVGRQRPKREFFQ